MVLEKIVEELERIDDSFVADGVASHFIRVREDSGPQLIIEANQAGLVHLASEILKVAASADPGSHFVLDETGMADTVAREIVFSFKQAHWD